MTATSIRRWMGVHKWTSLVCTVFLLFLCITGLPLVFHEEIQDATRGYDVPSLPTWHACTPSSPATGSGTKSPPAASG